MRQAALEAAAASCQMSDNHKHGGGGDFVVSVNTGQPPPATFVLGNVDHQPSSSSTVSVSPGGVYLSHKNPVTRTTSNR